MRPEVTSTSAGPTMVKAWVPYSSLTSTVEPTWTTPPTSACSMITALRTIISRVRIRPSSIPCSFLAASYSAFSLMSPKSLAYLIRSATSARRTVRSSSSSAASLSRPSLVSKTGLSMVMDDLRERGWDLPSAPGASVGKQGSIGAARETMMATFE